MQNKSTFLGGVFVIITQWGWDNNFFFSQIGSFILKNFPFFLSTRPFVNYFLC